MQFPSHGTKASGILLNLFSKTRVGGDASINSLQYSGIEGDLRYLRLVFLKLSNFEMCGLQLLEFPSKFVNTVTELRKLYYNTGRQQEERNRSGPIGKERLPSQLLR